MFTLYFLAMNDRVSKFSDPAQKRYAKLSFRVPIRHRAIYGEWLNLSSAEASEDLRDYIASRVRQIEKLVRDLPERDQRLFWEAVEREQRKAYLPGVGKGGRAREVQRRLRELKRAA